MLKKQLNASRVSSESLFNWQNDGGLPYLTVGVCCATSNPPFLLGTRHFSLLMKNR